MSLSDALAMASRMAWISSTIGSGSGMVLYYSTSSRGVQITGGSNPESLQIASILLRRLAFAMCLQVPPAPLRTPILCTYPASRTTYIHLFTFLLAAILNQVSGTTPFKVLVSVCTLM
jgi:hypothetical protein